MHLADKVQEKRVHYKKKGLSLSADFKVPIKEDDTQRRMSCS